MINVMRKLRGLESIIICIIENLSSIFQDCVLIEDFFDDTDNQTTASLYLSHLSRFVQMFDSKYL